MGFHMTHDGVIQDVEHTSVASLRGLRRGARIVKINDLFVINLTTNKMLELLRVVAQVRLTIIAPMTQDGTVRRYKTTNQ